MTLRTLRKISGEQTLFVIADLDPAYHAAARALVYQPVVDGFAKAYPSDTPHLDRIYEQFAQHAEAMVLQAAHVQPVPWEQALGAFLALVEGQAIDWWLGGSAALAARGIDIAPGDIDLIVDDAGAQRLGALLLEYLVEPVLPVQGWFCNWWGRAFLGARVEWIGGPDERADQPELGDFGPAAASRLEMISWQGRAIRVPPLDLQLAISQRRGRTETAAKIRRWLEDKTAVR